LPQDSCAKKPHDVAAGLHGVGGLVHDDDRTGPEHRAGAVHGALLERQVEVLLVEPRGGRAAGDVGLERVAVADAAGVLRLEDDVAERGDAVLDSNTPGWLTWPDTANMRVPFDASAPRSVKALLPLFTIQGMFDSVSTLFTIVGCRYRPLAAGKNGGLRRACPGCPRGSR